MDDIELLPRLREGVGHVGAEAHGGDGLPGTHRSREIRTAGGVAEEERTERGLQLVGLHPPPDQLAGHVLEVQGLAVPDDRPSALEHVSSCCA